ncbi:unnamed protein product, partial [Meganyctiphanes norvegica]
SVTMSTTFHQQTTQNSSILDDIICPICMEKYSLHSSHNPVMLPDCGHTICRDCLISIYKAEDHNKQVCPICRAPYVEQHPNALPANFIVLGMMQAHLSTTNKEPVEQIGSSYETEDFQNIKTVISSTDREDTLNSYDGKSISRIPTSNCFQGTVQPCVPIQNGPYRGRTSQESCVQLEKKCIPPLRIPTTTATTTTTTHIPPIHHRDIESNRTPTTTTRSYMTSVNTQDIFLDSPIHTSNCEVYRGRIVCFLCIIPWAFVVVFIYSIAWL